MMVTCIESPSLMIESKETGRKREEGEPTFVFFGIKKRTGTIPPSRKLRELRISANVKSLE